MLEGRELWGDLEVLGKEGLGEMLGYGNHKFLPQKGNGEASAELPLSKETEFCCFWWC